MYPLSPHFRTIMDKSIGLFVITIVACLFVSTLARTGLNTVDAWGNIGGGNNWGNRNLRNNNWRGNNNFRGNNNLRNNNWRNNNRNNPWGNNNWRNPRGGRNWGRNGLRGRSRDTNVWDHLSLMLPGK